MSTPLDAAPNSLEKTPSSDGLADALADKAEAAVRFFMGGLAQAGFDLSDPEERREHDMAKRHITSLNEAVASYRLAAHEQRSSVSQQSEGQPANLSPNSVTVAREDRDGENRSRHPNAKTEFDSRLGASAVQPSQQGEDSALLEWAAENEIQFGVERGAHGFPDQWIVYQKQRWDLPLGTGDTFREALRLARRAAQGEKEAT